MKRFTGALLDFIYRYRKFRNRVCVWRGRILVEYLYIMLVKGIKFVRGSLATISVIILVILIWAAWSGGINEARKSTVVIWLIVPIIVMLSAWLLKYRLKAAWLISLLVIIAFLPTIALLPLLIPCMVILLRRETIQHYWSPGMSGHSDWGQPSK